jgi:PKD repeat protein
VHIGDNLPYTGDANIYVGPGTTACPGDKLYFNASDAQSYFWDFGDGTTSTQQYPVHSFSDYGVHTVTLTLTNYCGNSKTVTTDITIDNSVIPNIDQNSYGSPSGGGCPGDSIIFYSVGGSHYIWDFGDGTSTTITHPIDVGNGQIADLTSHAYSAIGTYTVQLTYFNGCNNSVTKSFDVTVASGEPLIGGMAPVANPNSTCHEIIFAAFGGNTRTWDFGDGTVINSSSVEMTHTYTATGDYNLTVTITNGCGATATFNQEVIVNASDDAQTFYTDADGDGYGSDNAMQACVQPEGTALVNGDCDDGNANVHPGANDVCNGVDDNCNGVVDENPMVATIDPSGTVNFCKGSSITLTADNGSGLHYQWMKNSVAIAGATSQSYKVKKAGNYQVKENSTTGCSATSSATTVGIFNSPTATIIALGNLNICSTGSVTLQASSNTIVTYQWKRGAANLSGATNQTYLATKTGTYKCVVTGSNGCSKTSNGLKVVKSCREDPSSESENSLLMIYPNPSDGNFRVNLSTNSTEDIDAQLFIYNKVGQIIFSEKVNIENGNLSKEIHLGGSNPAGIYLLKVIAGNTLLTQQISLQ